MLLLLAVDIAALLDVPVLRLVLGLLFFTTIPGLLILYTLKLNELGFLKKFLLSIGLSLSFLVFFGLMVNFLLLWLGYQTPLSTISLIISLSIAVIILCLGAYWRNRKDSYSIMLPNLGADFRGKRLSLLLLPILFPILTVIGRTVTDAGGSNTLLVSLYIFIPLYVILVMWQNRNIPRMTYPLAIWMISLSILLAHGLISNYVVGGDIISEYHSFQVVSRNLYWSIESERSNGYASLSVSLLPAMLQSILGMNPLYIFKAVLIIPISLIPVAGYMIYERYLEPPYGFLLAFFYIAQLPFNFLLACQIRVGISLLSFVLALMVLFDDQIAGLNKRVLFLIFIFSLAVEYYVAPLLFMFLMFFLYLVPRIRRTGFSASMVSIESAILLPAVLVFFWWGQVTATAFLDYVWYSQQILHQLSSLFVAELRAGEITALYTQATHLHLYAQVPGFVQRFTFIAIAIGVVSILARKEHRSRFGSFAILMAVSLAILIAFIVVPWLSIGYGSDRIYMTPLVILAPAFIVGCREISSGIRIAWKYTVRLVKPGVSGHRLQSLQLKSLPPILIGAILVLQFFASTYLFNQLVIPSDAREVLDPKSKIYALAYVYDSEVQAAKWLGADNPGTVPVYYGNIRQRFSGELFEFTDYGVFRDFAVFPLPKEDRIRDSYVFLDHLTLDSGLIIGVVYELSTSFAETVPVSERAWVYADKNKVYAGGRAEIYR